jgi:hypothetical protein
MQDCVKQAGIPWQKGGKGPVENFAFKLIMVILLGGVFYMATIQPWVAAGLAVLWIVIYILFMNWKKKR